MLSRLTAFVLALAPVGGAGESDPGLPDFLLSSTSGERIGLFNAGQSHAATVIALAFPGCAEAESSTKELAKLARADKSAAARYLLVSTSPKLEGSALQQWAGRLGVGFPVLCDPLQTLAQSWDVGSTFEVFVFDREFNLCFRGGSGAGSAPQKAPGAIDLKDVIGRLAAGVKLIRTAPSGKPLPTQLAGTRFEEINYHQHVEPVIARQCLECHREGQIGPMTLESYGDVKGWAPMIAEVVLEERMPPWHANPRYGEFKNARRLTDTEKAILLQWSDLGAPEGKADVSKDFTPERYVEGGWSIGEPDRIFELPKDEFVPAEGVIGYRYVMVDPGFTEDCYVQAVEVRPTNTALTHHVLILLVPPGLSARDAMDDPNFFLASGNFAVNVPGGRPMILPDGYGIEVKKGARFLFQLHYTPNGEAGYDRSRLGIRLAKAKVTHRVRSRALVEFNFRIPPQEANYQFEARHSFEQPVRLLAIFPHLHARGKAFRVEREYGKKSEVLLDVPRYDFNWQHTYELQAPVAIRAGDSLHLTAGWDNSSGNASNPDPNATVRWGDQTFEEMFVAYITYIDEEPAR